MSKLWIGRDWVILRSWPSSDFVSPVAETAGHRQLTVHSGWSAILAFLDMTTTSVYALSLVWVFRLVVYGETLVGTTAVDDGPIAAAKQHSTVAHIGNAKSALTAVRQLVDDAHCTCGTTALIRGKECTVRIQDKLFDCRVVWRAPLRGELLVKALSHEGRALIASMAVEDAEEAPIGGDVNEVCVLHAVSPPIHLGEPNTECLAFLPLYHSRFHRLWQYGTHGFDGRSGARNQQPSGN
mmetsp:Transcript_14128/g.38750  ORF Transcript_14128/g.38750 Transcript_14128/m.38750 type:complete len:239 (+) Transcript_14128:1721-2437(+)